MTSLSTHLLVAAAVVSVLATANPIMAQRPGVASDSINALVGDVSWTARFGRSPTDADSEDARIRTHLDWVVARLSEVDVAHLDGVARTQRQRLISELAEYSRAGRFPHHTEGSTRRPRFVDERGNHCAVGHLMRHSGRSDLVQAIQEEHEYDLIRDIQVPGVAEWAAMSGLSVDELATIQPGYGSPRQPSYGSPGQPDGLGEVTRPENPAIRPSVEIRAGEGVDENIIRRTIRHHSARLRRCHEGQRRRFPTWAGRVEFEVVAQPGQRAEVRSLRTVEGVVVQCAQGVLMRLRFPSDAALTFRVAFDYSGRRSATRPTLTRALLFGLLDSLRSRVETCTQRRHQDTQVRVRARVRPGGDMTVRVSTSPRSRAMEQCVKGVLEDVSTRVQSEFEVSNVVRARRAWSVARGAPGFTQGQFARASSRGQALARTLVRETLESDLLVDLPVRAQLMTHRLQQLSLRPKCVGARRNGLVQDLTQ